MACFCLPSILVCSKAFFSILPIAQIAIGAVYLDDCPREHFIPIYLIVMGVFSLVLKVLSCFSCNDEPDYMISNQPDPICTIWNSLTSFLVLCWFIAGNVWIYTIYQPNYNKNTTNIETYCNKTLYLFAFWTTLLNYVLIAYYLVTSFYLLVIFLLYSLVDADADTNVTLRLECR